MNNYTKSKKSGFLQIIILIIIALVIMRYLGITFSGVVDWLANLLKYFGLTFSGIFNWFIDLFKSVAK